MISVYTVRSFLLNWNKGIVFASQFWGDKAYPVHLDGVDGWTTTMYNISRSEPHGFCHLYRKIIIILSILKQKNTVWINRMGEQRGNQVS